MLVGVQGYRERELSSKLTSFTLSGLQPGETYGIQLKTKVAWGCSKVNNSLLQLA
jgi:hypothetical protein